MNGWDVLLTFVFASMIGLGIGWLIGGGTALYYQSEAIERGYALHCPATGKWAWKGECEK